MIPISPCVDETEMRDQVEALFRGKAFKEQIVRLTQVTFLYKKEDVKAKLLSDAIDPLSVLFGSGLKSSKGQTIAEIPPIDITNPEADIEILEQHMHHQLYLIEIINGETTLKWALEIINKENSLSKESLSFLVTDNPIIPQGRERIFLSGLYHGMIGDLYLSLHILAPQVENLFRKVAEDTGAIVTTLNDDDTSDAKLLTSLFKLPELIDYFGEDILFLFSGLMNEKVGANIRNEIAHGLMGERKGNSAVARFFFCWVLKLLALTSPHYHEMLRDVETPESE